MAPPGDVDCAGIGPIALAVPDDFGDTADDAGADTDSVPLSTTMAGVFGVASTVVDGAPMTLLAWAASTVDAVVSPTAVVGTVVVAFVTGGAAAAESGVLATCAACFPAALALAGPTCTVLEWGR